MIDAFGWGIVIVPLIAQLALCRFLYLVLRQKVLADELKSLVACFLFCIVMAIIPWPVAGLTGGFGAYFYTNYPALRPTSWDIGLAWAIFFVFWFSYFVSIVCALFVCPNLWRTKQANKNEPAT